MPNNCKYQYFIQAEQLWDTFQKMTACSSDTVNINEFLTSRAPLADAKFILRDELSSSNIGNNTKLSTRNSSNIFPPGGP